MLLFLPYAIVTPSTLASSALSAHAHLCAIDIGDVDRPRCRDAARTRDVGRQRVAADRRPARHGARPRVGHSVESARVLTVSPSPTSKICGNRENAAATQCHRPRVSPRAVSTG